MAFSSHGGIVSAIHRHEPWTGVEVDKLFSLRDFEELGWPEIADQLGRSVERCMERYRICGGENVGVEQRGAKRAVRISNSYVERDNRIAAQRARADAETERGNVNYFFFNDPPPGYSALDRIKGRVG